MLTALMFLLTSYLFITSSLPIISIALPNPQILSKEAEFNWNIFFDKIQNSDYRESALEAAAEYMVQVGFAKYTAYL